MVATDWATWPRPSGSGGRSSARCRDIGRAGKGWVNVIQEQRLAEADKLAAELMKDGRFAPRACCSSAGGPGGRPPRRSAGGARIGAAEFPGDLESLRERCQFLFHHGTAEEAERRWGADRPRCDVADAHHNLGTLLMRCQRHDEAVVAYRQSLRYRPNYVATYQYLGYVLKDSGRLAEAAAVWEQATAAGRASET